MHYEPTHRSLRDGSTAMFVAERDGLIELMNEDGDTWVDPSDLWAPIEAVEA